MSEQDFSNGSATNSKANDEANKLLLEKLTILTDKMTALEEKMDYKLGVLSEKLGKLDFKMHQIDGKVKKLDETLENSDEDVDDLYEKVENLEMGKEKEDVEEKEGTSQDTDAKTESGLIMMMEKILKRRIPTGSFVLDEVSCGGIEPGSITCILGDSKSGKTQFCYTLAVTCQLINLNRSHFAKDEHTGGKCLWIDCGGSFCYESFDPIAKRFKLDPKEVTKNVVYFPCLSTEKQMGILKKIPVLFTEYEYSLIVVEDVMHHFRGKYSGEMTVEQTKEYMAESEKFLKQLKNLAEKLNISIVVTNGQKDVVGDNRKLLVYTATGFWLGTNKDGNKYCYIYKSPYLPEITCPISITDEGLCDFKE